MSRKITRTNDVKYSNLDFTLNKDWLPSRRIHCTLLNCYLSRQWTVDFFHIDSPFWFRKEVLNFNLHFRISSMGFLMIFVVMIITPVMNENQMQFSLPCTCVVIIRFLEKQHFDKGDNGLDFTVKWETITRRCLFYILVCYLGNNKHGDTWTLVFFKALWNLSFVWIL